MSGNHCDIQICRKFILTLSYSKQVKGSLRFLKRTTDDSLLLCISLLQSEYKRSANFNTRRVTEPYSKERKKEPNYFASASTRYSVKQRVDVSCSDFSHQHYRHFTAAMVMVVMVAMFSSFIAIHFRSVLIVITIQTIREKLFLTSFQFRFLLSLLSTYGRCVVVVVDYCLRDFSEFLNTSVLQMYLYGNMSNEIWIQIN
jgi:hypothetical protein